MRMVCKQLGNHYVNVNEAVKGSTSERLSFGAGIMRAQKKSRCRRYEMAYEITSGAVGMPLRLLLD